MELRELFNQNFKSIIKLMREDLKNIEDGKYKLPYDLEFGYAPQWSPLPVARQLNNFIRERTSVMERSTRKGGLDVRRNFKAGKGMYPEYYLQNFHYQTDGWMSASSAQIYDYAVESLFFGMADAMRRQIVPFFSEHIRSLQSGGRRESDIKVLDVATGKIKPIVPSFANPTSPLPSLPLPLLILRLPLPLLPGSPSPCSPSPSPLPPSPSSPPSSSLPPTSLLPLYPPFPLSLSPSPSPVSQLLSTTSQTPTPRSAPIR